MKVSFILLTVLLIATMPACKTVPQPLITTNGCSQNDRINRNFCDANAILSKINSEIRSTAVEAKTSGAPNKVKVAYAGTRERYNSFVTYYSSCIKDETCSDQALDQHLGGVNSSYQEFIGAYNTSMDTSAQEPITAAAVIALIKEIAPLVKNGYAWLKGERLAARTEKARAISERLNQMRTDWTLPTWEILGG